MKSMTVARQFMILVLAFAVAMPASVCGLAYVFYKNGAVASRISAEGDSRTDGLFKLVASFGQVQGITQRLVREKDPDEIEKLVEKCKAATRAAQERIRGAGLTAGEVASAFDSLSRADEKSIGLLLKGDYGLAQEVLITESNPAFERLLVAIGKTQEASNQQENAVVAAADASSTRSQISIFVLVGIVLAGLITFAVIMGRRITATLQRAVDELRRAADGTATAASQIATSSQFLAESSSQQASSLEETSASTDEISSMTNKNADHCRSAADKMRDTAQQVSDANERLEQLISSMNSLNAASGKVSKIIRTIDEIAFQTNILALNAAVEAARAGEAGLSFAVVAGEVRNLAQRSAQAAQETASLIEDSISKTKDGKTKLDQLALTIQSITQSTGDVKVLVDEILVASEEQAQGIQQVSTALNQVGDVTQRTAASAEEGVSVGEELSAQATTLKSTVDRLTSMVYVAS